MAALLRDGYSLRSVFTEEELATIPSKSLVIKGQSEATFDKGLNPNERHLAWVNSCKDVETMVA